MVSALLLIWLFLLAFGGSYWLVRSTHRRIAMQSRLDICAVRLASSREQLLGDLTRLNRPLQLSIWGLYATRGVKLLGPVAAGIGGMGEIALLQLNRTLSLTQEARILAAQAKELGLYVCAATPYSKTAAGCSIQPSAKGAFLREKTLFPDVMGTLKQIKAPLARVRCASMNLQQTALLITGDAQLQTTNFTDRYEK